MKLSKADGVEREYYTTSSAGKLLGVKTETIRSWIKKGLLPAVKVGYTYFVKIEDVNAMLSPNKEKELQ